jgi:hypothetical protein
VLKSFFSKYFNLYLFNLGFLFDFFIKKILEFFIKHIFVYLSLFFAEKFLIEYITKKNIELIIFFLNKNHNFFYFTFLNFFFTTITLFFLFSTVTSLFLLYVEI